LYLGRKDHQVKIYGQRLELAEIEAIIGDGGHDVTVMLLKTASNQPQLVAFFKFDAPSDMVRGDDKIDSASCASQDVSRSLECIARWKLPSYMVPSFVPVRQIPLTSNGKADRDCLQRLFENGTISAMREAEEKATSLPQRRTATEARLCQILAEMFEVSNISVDCDLFSGILDSLSSMRLVAHLRKTFGLPIRLHWILETRTICGLAAKIDSSGGATALDGNTAHSSLLEEDDRGTLDAITQFSHSTGPKVFCLHPVSGLSYDFRNIVPFLPEFSVVGINDPHLGEEVAYGSINNMARVYVSMIDCITTIYPVVNTHTKSGPVTDAMRAHTQHKLILQHQPKGPFFLLGYSFGAHVAVEIARLLQAQHFDIKLILVDSSVEPRTNERFRDPARVAAVFESVKRGVEPRSSRNGEGKGGLLTMLEAEVTRNLRLLTAYQMSRYAGQATLLKAFGDPDEERGYEGNRSNGYEGLVSEFRVESVYGDHYKLFTDEQYLTFNGEVIRKVLGVSSSWIH
jgi:enterobactin synthetase component F